MFHGESYLELSRCGNCVEFPQFQARANGGRWEGGSNLWRMVTGVLSETCQTGRT